MDSRTHRAIATAAALCLISTGGAQTVGVAGIEVGPTVQVSRSHAADAHFEVLACAHPTDPARLLVGSVVYGAQSSRAGTVIYASRDQGRSWATSLDGPALENTGDPACAYAGNGTAYYTASLIPAAGDRIMLFLRSSDGGTTWDRTSLTYSDRQYVTVDATGGRFDGRVYVNGNNRVPRGVSDFVVFTSSDSGRTFRGPGKRAEFGSVQAPVMGNAVVASDGRLIGIQAAQRRGSPRVTLDALVSTDGGETVGSDVTISDFVPGGNRKGTDNNANDQPVVAIDATRGAYRDRLYVTWPDRRSGHSQIFFSASSDLGKSWSPARAINDGAPGDSTDQLMPTVAVNRDGAVGVLWYDRRDHPDNMGWDARFTASVDGGTTFLPSVRLSPRGTTFGPANRWGTLQSLVTRTSDAFQIRVGLNNFTFLGGDTAGLVADALGVFHPVWVDNHTGIPQVWTAAVRVGTSAKAVSRMRAPARDSAAPLPVTTLASTPKGAASEPPGGPAARTRTGTDISGTDISGTLELIVSRTAFDAAHGILALTAQLRNSSAAALRGPFVLRIGSLPSELATSAIAMSDNGTGGAGAEWGFADAVLEPGASSQPRRLRFTVAEIRPFRDDHHYRLGLLDLSATVSTLERRP